MDLNQLYHREGVERLRAEEAACAPSRQAHLVLAGFYRERIEALRLAAGAVSLAPAL